MYEWMVLLSYSLYKHIQITFDNHKVCIYTQYGIVLSFKTKTKNTPL